MISASVNVIRIKIFPLSLHRRKSETSVDIMLSNKLVEKEIIFGFIYRNFRVIGTLASSVFYFILVGNTFSM